MSDNAVLAFDRPMVGKQGNKSNIDRRFKFELGSLVTQPNAGKTPPTSEPTASVRPESVIREVLSSPGSALEPSAAAVVRPPRGHDFSQVRIHTDGAAAASASLLSARAYTVGSHIVFGGGEYSASTTSGRQLLAHELAHVVQQGMLTIESAHSHAPLRIAGPSECQEREADDVAVGIDRRPNGEARTRASITRGCSMHLPHRELMIHRKIRLGRADLDAAGAKKIAAELLAGPLRGLPGGPALVREAVSEMNADPDLLTFAMLDDLAANVRDRVLASHYMRVSQGSKPGMKAFSYPDREGDGTKGTPAKVNDAAAALWGPVQSWPGNYYFDLSPAGKANPYEALLKLFTEQRDPRKRTLIHCDYLVSVIEFRAYAENLGPKRFNALVASGAIPMRLKYDGFADLRRLPLPTAGPGGAPTGHLPPLTQVTLTDEKELLIGDHVTFFNHETYDVLTSVKHDVWRLENAIVIDRAGGQFRYQGHGYFSPVTKDALLDGMLAHYNRNVDKALAIAGRAAHPGAAGSVAKAELARDYPNVREPMPGHWVIAGPSRLCGGRPVQRDLKHLTRAEAPALHYPCDGAIRVNRPIPQKPR